MNREIESAHVNSSFTTFFLVFLVGFAVVLGSLFDVGQGIIIALIGFALLMYFVWDLIRQLYSAGQALLLYFTIFLVLPGVLNLTLSFMVGSYAIALYIAALLAAMLAEIIYEVVAKKVLPKKVVRRLLSVDAKIDKSIVALSVKHVQLSEFKGIAIALGLAVVYTLAAIVLLHR